MSRPLMTLLAAACTLALGFLAPAWAINKCTDADGRVYHRPMVFAAQQHDLAALAAVLRAVHQTRGS